MKKKLLILSIYPAPYRVEVIDSFHKYFDVKVFFEKSTGDSRDAVWFKKGSYYTLDNINGNNTFKDCIKDLKENNLVLIYDYSTKCALNLILRCIQRNIPYVINADGVMLTKHENFVKNMIKRIVVSKAAGCFASGNLAKNYFMRYGAKEKNVYLHTFSTLHTNDIQKFPVDLKTKNKIRAELGLAQSKFIAIAVGRFIPLKRYAELITEWTKMPENYLLLLIGGGEEENKYRQIIEELHIQNVQIEGFYQKEELKRFYMASDVFVHPTSYDVWGLVVNEAMAAGLPTVVSDHCVAGLELIKDGENGFIVPMGNDKSLCDKVKNLHDVPELYKKMCQASLDTIADYTIENMASVQIEAVREILKIDSNTN